MASSIGNTTAFWAEDGPNQIRSSGIFGGTASGVITTGLTNPYGVAVDSSGVKLYYSDYGTKTVNSSLVDGSSPTVLASSLSSPKGVAVDIANDKLYWCDDSDNTITRSDQDGSNASVIVSGVKAVDVALDIPNAKMYWTVGEASGSLMVADLDGSNSGYLTTGSGDLGDVLTSYSGQIFYDGDVFVVKSIKLSEGKHVVIYSHSAAANSAMYGKVIDFVDNIATSGDEFTLKGASTYPGYKNATNIQRISDDQFFMVHGQDSGTDIDIISLSGVSDNELSVDSTYEFDAGFMYEMNTTEMVPQTPTTSGIYMLIAKSLGNNKCYIRTLAVSGTTTIAGSNVAIDNELNHTQYLSVGSFNTTEFVTFFAPTGVNKSRYRYGSISGLTVTMGTSGNIGNDKLVEHPLCERLEEDKIVMFGEISDDDNRIYMYNLEDSVISETPVDGIATQHSDKHALTVLDSSTIALCTHEHPDTRVQICKLTDTSGSLGEIITKDEAAYLWFETITSNSFALYSANGGDDIGEVEVFTVNSSGGLTTSGSLSYPRSIDVNSDSSKIYWTNYYVGDTSEVCSINTDGSSSGVLVSTGSGFQGINGLVIDTQSDKIYVTDETLGVISKFDIDGTNVEVVGSGLSSPQGIDLMFSPIHNVSLYTCGFTIETEFTGSSNLFISGSVPETSGALASRVINFFTNKWDYYPQIVDSFDMAPTSVNVELWDVINGLNTRVTLTSSGCTRIGDTSNWCWSTENLPFDQSYSQQQYYYRMISNFGEQQCGEFFINMQ